MLPARRARLALLAAPTSLAAAMPGPLVATLGAQSGGRHAAVVLALPASPRAAALADAFGAVGGDDAALFYAPAQLATVRAGAGASVERFLAGTTLAAASAATRAAGGTLAVGVQSLAYDAIEETRDFAPTGATLRGGELALSAGYARAVGGVRVGLVGKLARQRLAEASGQAIAGDVGIAWTVPAATAGAGRAARALAGITVAGAVQHVGGELALLGRAAPLPRRVRLGAARTLALAPGVDVLALAEVVDDAGESARPAAAAELRWRVGRTVAIEARGGVRRRLRDDALPAVTVGGGVRLGAVTLDYARQGYGPLGATHRVGIRWAR